MANTGYKIYQNLEEYNVDTGVATGNVKPNVDTDPDYISPVLDTTFCPVSDSPVSDSPVSDTTVSFTDDPVVDGSTGNTTDKSQVHTLAIDPALNAGETMDLNFGIDLGLSGDYLEGTSQAEARITFYRNGSIVSSGIVRSDGITNGTVTFFKADMTSSLDSKNITGTLTVNSGNLIEVVLEVIVTAESPNTMSATATIDFPSATFSPSRTVSSLPVSKSLQGSI